MIELNWKEALGILSTLLVAVSLMQKQELPLRILNLVGSVLFVVYGFLIDAFSVWLLNSICAGANVYHIHRLLASRDVKPLNPESIESTDPLTKTPDITSVKMRRKFK